jgi:hypothetical protein
MERDLSDLIDLMTRQAGGAHDVRRRSSSDSPSRWIIRIAAGAAIIVLLAAIAATLWSRAPGRSAALAVVADVDFDVSIAQREAIKHLVCTIRTTNDSAQRATALQKISHFAVKIPVEALREIEREALRGCSMASADRQDAGRPMTWRHGEIAVRSNPVVVAFFYPGDLIVTGLYEASILSGVYPLARLIDDLIRSIGDLLVGAVSLCFWCLALRFGFILTVILAGMNLAARRQDETRPERASAELSPCAATAATDTPAPAQEIFARDYNDASDTSFRA